MTFIQRLVLGSYRIDAHSTERVFDPRPGRVALVRSVIVTGMSRVRSLDDVRLGVGTSSDRIALAYPMRVSIQLDIYTPPG